MIGVSKGKYVGQNHGQKCIYKFGKVLYNQDISWTKYWTKQWTKEWTKIKGIGEGSIMSRWDVVFDPKLGDMKEILPLIVKIEAFRISVLKLPIPPALARAVNEINIVRQIKGTTGIEGNTLTEEQISTIVSTNEHRDEEENQKITQEEREAINAKEVINYIKDYAQKNDDCITEELVKTIHFINTNGCDYKNNIPGQYRNYQNVAGDYTPPPPDDIPDLMRRFVDFINCREIIDGHNPLLRAIIAHFYLVTIHPFGDGNGRTSRALEAYILYKGGYNTRGFYSLANYYYKNRARYIEMLQDARFKHRGNLTEFIIFSLEGFIEELNSVQDTILVFYTRLGFESYLNEMLSDDEINARQYNLLMYMMRTGEEISLNEFRTKRHPFIVTLYEKVSEKTVSRDIKSLTDKELVLLQDGKIRPNIGIMKNFLQ